MPPDEIAARDAYLGLLARTRPRSCSAPSDWTCWPACAAAAGYASSPRSPTRGSRSSRTASTTRRSTLRWRGTHPAQESDTVVTVVRRLAMAHRALAVVAVLALIFGAFSPVYAASPAGMGGGGGMRGGGNWHGNFHGNFHGRGCCCCGTRVFVGIGGGFAWGPWWWGSPWWGSPWAYPWPYPSFASAPPATSWAQGPSSSAPAGMQQTITAVQREVVFPNGKYVLYGDGVNQPWQWVWVPSAPPPPPQPPTPQ